jgi:hypothetical protein
MTQEENKLKERYLSGLKGREGNKVSGDETKAPVMVYHQTLKYYLSQQIKLNSIDFFFSQFKKISHDE